MAEIGAAAAAALQNAAAPATAPPDPKAASPEAVQQLESLMRQPVPEPAPPEIAPVDAAAAPATPGDAILKGIERLSHGFDSQMEQIGSLAATPGGGPMSAADMRGCAPGWTQSPD